MTWHLPWRAGAARRCVVAFGSADLPGAAAAHAADGDDEPAGRRLTFVPMPSPAGHAVRLRAHHLLCILTFAGAGYSDEFVANLRAVIRRLAAGAPVRLASGPDDICAALSAGSSRAHCNDASVAGRDTAAAAALAAVTGLESLFAGGTIPIAAETIADLRARFATGDVRGACTGCEWSALCTEIAARDFAAAELYNGAAQRRVRHHPRAGRAR